MGEALHKIHEAQERYEEKFGEYLPLICMDLNEEEAIELIEKHISSGKKFEYHNLPDDALI